MDKGAIVNLRRFLTRHAGVQKWIVAADFSLGKNRPLGCFAFTIIPYDAWPWEIERDAVSALAKDLKTPNRFPRAPFRGCGMIGAFTWRSRSDQPAQFS
jgi:hypothetical protein